MPATTTTSRECVQPLASPREANLFCRQAYNICDSRDLVPEMVFLLGRMGDNKRALNLIIERLGDVQRVSFPWFDG